MRKQETFLITVIIIMVILSLTGCLGKENAMFPDTEAAETSKIQQREEIKIDFPFYDSEEYTLTLAKLPDSADEYELMLYRKDREVLQQISCGKLAEPIEFSYDGLRYGYYHDLEIFSSGSGTGLLFLWENERFSQEAIEIPNYDEVRNWFMLTVTEDGEELVPILKINFVYREDGTLYCRDYYHNQKIFGTTESTLEYFYDEKERIEYKSGYITHGYVEYYYIYEDESDKPAYCLYLDHNLGYAIPAMVKYH